MVLHVLALLVSATLALWVGPFVLLALGIAVLVRRLRRRPAPEPRLSEAERTRAARLLE